MFSIRLILLGEERHNVMATALLKKLNMHIFFSWTHKKNSCHILELIWSNVPVLLFELLEQSQLNKKQCSGVEELLALEMIFKPVADKQNIFFCFKHTFNSFEFTSSTYMILTSFSHLYFDFFFLVIYMYI